MTFDHNRILSQQVNPHMKLILELLWLQSFQTLTLVHLNGPMPPQENRCIQEVIIWILYFFNPLSSLTWILDNVKSPFDSNGKCTVFFCLPDGRWHRMVGDHRVCSKMLIWQIHNIQSRLRKKSHALDWPKKCDKFFSFFLTWLISCLEELQVERERNTTYELLYPLFSAKLTAY